MPDTPGLEVEFNEELAKKQTFKFWKSSHLRRLDGAHTNWERPLIEDDLDSELNLSTCMRKGIVAKYIGYL